MLRRLITSFISLTFLFTNLPFSQAQDFILNQLPVPGTMVEVSQPFSPLTLKGLVVNPRKPLEFQFLVDTGKDLQDASFIKEEANRLVKYFLAGLTIPEGELWVNLSPYERNRITTLSLGQTELGRDLLAQDYILKQLTASLIYPEKDLGKEFWNRVYAKAQKEFGTTDVPVNTFNKVWILPDEAQVFENGPAVYVTKATLKVMLDEDYLAMQRHGLVSSLAPRNVRPSTAMQLRLLGANIVRDIVLPEITKEVNTGKNFAPLRQIYNALILAKWYKEKIQNGILDRLYTDKNKLAGINLNDPAVKEQIYQRYLQAYKKGVFNYIKEDITPDGQTLPRKYFSGGTLMRIAHLKDDGAASAVQSNGAMISISVALKQFHLHEMGSWVHRYSFPIAVVATIASISFIGWWSARRFLQLRYLAGKITESRNKIKTAVLANNEISLTKAIKEKIEWEIKYQIIFNGYTPETDDDYVAKENQIKEALGFIKEGHDFEVYYVGPVSYNDQVFKPSSLHIHRRGEFVIQNAAMTTVRSTRAPLLLMPMPLKSGLARLQRALPLAKRQIIDKTSEVLELALLFLEERQATLDQMTLKIKGIVREVSNEMKLAVPYLAKKEIVPAQAREDIDTLAAMLKNPNSDYEVSKAAEKAFDSIVLRLKEKVTALKEGPEIVETRIQNDYLLKVRYQAGLAGLESRFPDVVEWALDMLVKSANKNARGAIKKLIADLPKNTYLTASRRSELQEVAEFQMEELLTVVSFPPRDRDRAMSAENGGIDLNQISVKRTTRRINVQFDQAQLNELTQGGFEGFSPVIVRITHISSPLPLLGIGFSKEPNH